jgi:hypothetical protein
MPLISMTWHLAAVLAVLAAAAGWALRGWLRWQQPGAGSGRRTRALSVLASALVEVAVVLGLFTLWQLAGAWALTRVEGAFQRAQWILDVESHTGLPSELTVQQTILGHDALIRFVNVFYLYVHINSIVIFLVWMFWRHRDRYRWARNTIVLLTGSCLLVQMIPVAPPRMLHGDGFVDLALAYGQSIYGAFGSGTADQLSALPSVHVAWALLIAFFVLTVSTSRWRWLILLHPVATIYVVVATANHYWLDGISAGILLAAALPVTDAIERRRARREAGRRVTVDQPREMLGVT